VPHFHPPPVDGLGDEQVSSMLDPKFIREHEAEVRQALLACNSKADLDQYLALDKRRRELLAEVDVKKAKLNQSSEAVGKIKKQGGDATALMAENHALSAEIKKLDTDVTEAEKAFRDLALTFCNLPHPSVPVGGEEHNLEVRAWGEKPTLTFTPKAHDDLATALGILDMERASKASGARFYVLTGAGARLERALINFMLDRHSANGYTECLPPHLVTYTSMETSGQFPKFVEQAFAIEKDGLYLIPTAEVPVTNLHRDEVLTPGTLPRKYASYTPCYRREAGSYGKDTKGLIRLHQFNKVELFQFVEPEKSMDALEALTADAESILQALKLPYRVVALATGDKSFGSVKTYDLEVWLPSQNTYREISSCSNCSDFQARRGGIRFRRDAKSKPELVHTLNGSGLAVGRTWLAILENYQQADGSVLVPEVLKPYMGGIDVIRKP
jgi:seryl-tRNA synthetase